MQMGSSVNSPFCLWALSTTAARLRAEMTASCGAPLLTTLMKMGNMDFALMNVSFAYSFQHETYTVCAAMFPNTL